MKFAIKHEIKGRIRIHLAQKHMTYRQADILQYYLEEQKHQQSFRLCKNTGCDCLLLRKQRRADPSVEQIFL